MYRELLIVYNIWTIMDQQLNTRHRLKQMWKLYYNCNYWLPMALSTIALYYGNVYDNKRTSTYLPMSDDRTDSGRVLSQLCFEAFLHIGLTVMHF